MGLAWQQGPLASGAVGRFLVAGPLPGRLLFAERLRRRVRVRFGGEWIADGEDVVLLHEPGRYPVAYFQYYDTAGADGAAWSYADAWPEAGKAGGMVSFEPGTVEVDLDGTRMRREPGQSVIAHGADRDLSAGEAGPGRHR